MHKSVWMAAALLVLSGCAVGPDYEKPQTPEPETFSAEHQAGDFPLAEQRFWQGFDDPLLAELIGETLVANFDLQGAVARYDRAAALLYGTRREQWPSLTVSASGAEQHLADVERTPAGAGPERVEVYQAGLNASWELDLFGRLRRATESQKAELAASGADVGALQVALAGQLANTYFELRGLQQRLLVAEQNVILQEETLAIVTARLDAGRGTEFDQVRARAQLERTRAALPSLRAAIQVAMHRIAVLTGRSPAALLAVLSPVQPLPDSVPVIPVDSPAEVLRRRPDIAAAEQRLAAATARVGVATADLFPRFTLSGLLGSVATDSSDLFSGSAESRRVALGVDWTFLDYGKVRARIEASDADSRAALAAYQQAVLLALEEAESRLVSYREARARAERLMLASEDAGRAAELARTRYERGFIGYFEVLAAEQELTVIRDAEVRGRTNEVQAMVAVYRALAGAPQPQQHEGLAVAQTP
ncbi:NodT family RND efflux system outer membrane lipoprotein [Alcanivorax nanhaiticus]|uniref:NodT family RND efflux system outer membrane lipoprotein n=1 Tax=Alcanivorax nanhaiticus TaxID=1177154 RepID=A0A095TS82_9GAMM|nr:efflux transporter outer membrane subunit [Alcanivorax nanhaiticus]KGD65233.1 NodT family RND efflux system outer membrane lipoprotein [Alcanivorax nanhaiticus]